MSGWKDAFVREGYEQEFYIAPKEGLHGELRGTFEPSLVRDTEKAVMAIQRVQNSDPDKATELRAALIARQLRGWNSSLDITVENVMRLRLTVFFKLFKIVCLEEPSDIDPEPSSHVRESLAVSVGKS